jgi:VanZ family protein
MARFPGLLWSWAPVLIWMATILALSSQSDVPVRTNPQTGETIRTTFAAAKLAHIIEYGVLALLLLRALMSDTGGVRLSLGVAVAVAVILSGLFGGLDELRQSFVPRREPSLVDIVLDTGAALVAVVIVAAWLRYRRLRSAALTLARTAAAGGSDEPVPAPSRAGEQLER